MPCYVSFYSTLLSFYNIHIFSVYFFLPLSMQNLSPPTTFYWHLIIFVGELEKRRSVHSYPFFTLPFPCLGNIWSIHYNWNISVLLFILLFGILFCSSLSWKLFFLLKRSVQHLPFLSHSVSSSDYQLLSLPLLHLGFPERMREKKIVMFSVLGFLLIHSTGSNCYFPFVGQTFVFLKGNGRLSFLESLL